jgi:predicted DNA-binding transcriptional regulator AlpA
MTICCRHYRRTPVAETFAPEILLDTVAAARRLGVSPSFLAKARMQGDGPRYRKLGRAVRYAQADLDHWLLACSRTSTAEQATGIGRPARKGSSKA